MSTLTLQQRALILDKELREATRDGWRVVSRTDTTAQLTRPHKWSCLGVIFFWVIYALLRKKDDGLYIEVNDKGKVGRRFS